MATTTRAQPLLRSFRTSEILNPRHSRFENSYTIRRDQQHGANVQHVRPFSSTSIRSGPGVSAYKPKQKPQKSIAVAMQEMAQSAEIPDDVGLMEGTFIQPIYENRPDWLTDTRRRIAWERARASAKLKDLFQREFTRRHYITKEPPEVYKEMGRLRRFGTYFHSQYDLERWKLVGYAEKLYSEMYTCFAKGNIDAMRPRLCETIYQTLASRIQTRAPNTRLEWKLHQLVGKPWVCSYRVGILSADPKPSNENNVIQQAVVRIKSIQSLKTIKRVRNKQSGTTEEVVTGGEEQLKIEYVVIQKMLRKGKPGPWMVWGTTTETTMEKIEADEKKQLALEEEKESKPR
ncbi:hypothetical protein MBLNU457_4169t3 [Dothideomycetes sp. NU457]